MKKQILTLGMMCAAAFALTNCDKQSTEPQRPTEGTPFEIIASTVDTKTANKGLKTVWVENDALNVFHAVAGAKDYGTNDKFTWTGTDNKFSGDLTEGLEDGSYDWYALYPYGDYLTAPNGTGGYMFIGDSRGVTQDRNNSKTHLSDNRCPLYGVAKDVAYDAPVNIAMHHLASVVKIVVKNSNDAELTVNKIVFTAEQDIVGQYFFDITGDKVGYTPRVVEENGSKVNKAYNDASLTVTNGTPIAKGESAEFYIPIKPFTAAASSLKISVNGYEKSPKSSENVTFTAGQIKGVTFNYDKVETPETGSKVEFVFDYTSTDVKNADWEISKDGVTLAWSSGENSYGNVPSPNKDGSIRMYVGTTLTISAPTGTKVTKVQFTPTSAKYSATNLSYNGTALADEWVLSSPSNSVELKANANARFKNIVVFYE